MAVAAPKPVAAAPFTGSAVAVDFAGYLAQHEVVYNAPPRRGVAAMPIGDGDLTGMVWCPDDGVRIQVNKADLLQDVTVQGAPARLSQALSAGAIAIRTSPAPLASPEKFEQRLNLYSATVSLEASAEQGNCQVQAWIAASAGVLCVHYSDSVIKSSHRYVEVRAPRNARPFAINDHIGLVEALPDRRCALVCRVVGATPTLGWSNAATPRFELQSARGMGFGLLVAVAVTNRDADPVSAAKARLSSAMRSGFDTLMSEHRMHWRAYWQKSFLHLGSPDGLASYVENLWYLNLYQMASCGRGQVPVAPDGSAWATDCDDRPGTGVYRTRNTQMLYWPMYAANHLEVAEPFAEHLHRIRPALERETRTKLRSEGLRVPEVMDRKGVDARHAHDGSSEALVSLECAVHLFWRWRYSDDREFLARHAYPFLRGCMAHHLACIRKRGGSLNPEEIAPLRFGLRALLEMSADLEADRDAALQWAELLNSLPRDYPSIEVDDEAFEQEGIAPPQSDVAPVFPFGDVLAGSPAHEAAVDAFRRRSIEWTLEGWSVLPIVAARLGLRDTIQGLIDDWIERFQAHPQGFFALDPSGSATGARSISLEPAAILAMTVNEMCVQGHGGVLRLFPALPWDWEGVFSLRTDDGFHVMAQYGGRELAWAAIESYTGRRCRLVNPWSGVARVALGRADVVRSADRLLEFDTERGGIYVVDRPDRPLARMVRVRMTGRHAVGTRSHGSRQLGID